MAHTDLVVAQGGLDGWGQFQQPDVVIDRSPVFTNPVAQLFLFQITLMNQPLITEGNFYGSSDSPAECFR